MFTHITLTISVLAATATALGPQMATAQSSPPGSEVCSGAVSAAQFRPAWCGKKVPPASYEHFRKALAEYQAGNSWLVDAVATAIGQYQPLTRQCKDNPPVNPAEVQLIVGGMRLNGNSAKERSEQALNQMSAVVDAVFDDGPTTAAEVKAVLGGLQAKLSAFANVMELLDDAGDLYAASACNVAEEFVAQASEELVAAGQFNNESVVSLSKMLAATRGQCKTTKVKKPFSDKQMRKATGAVKTKTVTAGEMSMRYPTSLSARGRTIWLPINLNSSAPSAYVVVELRQGAKRLAAVGGGTPSGESGLQVKLVGKPKRGKATLRIMSSVPGGAQSSEAVSLRVK